MDRFAATDDAPRTEVRITVPLDLLEALPAEIRADPERIESYLLHAMEIGVKAMALAGVHLDTDLVRVEFERFSDQLGDMRDGLESLLAQELTAEDSRLARSLKEYLSDEGRLGRTVRDLSRALSDPASEESIPGRIRTLLDANFKHADSPFQRALNIGDDASPLKRFVSNQDRKLREFQEDLVRKHQELSEAINASFEKIFDHIGYKSDLKEAEERGTRKGFSFEDQVCEVMSAAAFHKDRVERVGEENVDGTRVKRGDVLVHIEQDGFDPQRIVVEAKAGGYTLAGKDGLLGQLSDAMAYRDAGAGIAVVTRDHAGKRQRCFDRRGSGQIIAIVDPEDEQGGFLTLEVAYAVLRESLLARQQAAAGTGPDLVSAEETVNQIDNVLQAVVAMKRNCTEAKKNVEAVRQSIEDLENDLRDKLGTLRRQLGVVR